MDLANIEQQMTTAIGQQETSGGTAGVGVSLNNPGALKYADWEAQYGATQGSNGFAQFPSLSQGWQALTARIGQLVSGGSSVQSLINTYSPPSDGNTNNAQRVSQIANTTGLDPSQPIASQVNQANSNNSLIPPDVSDNANPDANPQTIATVGSSTGSGLWGRVAAFLVGIVCLILGIVLLKQSQTIIEAVGKTAGAAATAV